VCVDDETPSDGPSYFAGCVSVLGLGLVVVGLLAGLIALGRP
jgi:hypothetical protein